MNLLHARAFVEAASYDYNVRYFDGLIPSRWPVQVLRRARPGRTLAYFQHRMVHLPGLGPVPDGRFVYFEDYLYRADEVRVRWIVLHEMTHAWLFVSARPCGHTPLFKKRLYWALAQEFDGVQPLKNSHRFQDVKLRDGQMQLSL